MQEEHNYKFHIYICVYTYEYIYIYVYLCMYIYIYMFTYMYVYRRNTITNSTHSFVLCLFSPSLLSGCSVLQCVAVCCSVLQCVAVCVAVCCTYHVVPVLCFAILKKQKQKKIHSYVIKRIYKYTNTEKEIL